MPTFEKQEFEMTKGLLSDVMRKQAGSLEKAVLEAVMNSVDAGATRINITIREDSILIEDDGAGMDKWEIDEYFKKFGLKDDDIEEKDFGKFRIGRGQIFNFGVNIWHTNDYVLIVNLEDDETTVEIENEEYTVDTSGLGYQVAGEVDKSVDGCHIEMELYDEVKDYPGKAVEVKNLIKYVPWVHDVEITVNNDTIDKELDVTRETDLAYFSADTTAWTSRTEIYNQGAKVKSEKLTPIKGAIITKVDLDVNFARNDILRTEDNWSDIQEQYEDVTREQLAENVDDLEYSEVKWMLKQAEERPSYLNQIEDLAIIPDINGVKWSIEEIGGQDITFSRSGNKTAEELMEQIDVLILEDAYKGLLDDLIENSEIIEYSSVIESGDTFEMSVLDKSDLSKTRQENLKKAEWFLEEVGNVSVVKPGWSKHSNAWKDDTGTIYLHKGLLNMNKMEFLTEGLVEIMTIAAHDGDSRQGRDYNLRFKKKFWDYGQKFAEAQRKLINGTADYE